MTSNKQLERRIEIKCRFVRGGFFVFLAALCSACLDNSSASFSKSLSGLSLLTNPSSNPVSTVAGGNVMSVTVNGSQCGSSQYVNQPCVSVTICQPGTTTCQTIDNILLDTGSFGLRIFQSVITVPLTPITINGANLAECQGFGDGSSEWGQVEYADVQLAGEPMVKVPMEVINSTYATPPALCSSSQSTPDTGPTQTLFNGILGVGLWGQDCGDYCATITANQQYYACTGTNCVQTAAPGAVQVTNPVALLPQDNNGVILQLPAVPAGGVASAVGSLVIGIGTQANNSPGTVTAYPVDNSTLDFMTRFSSYSTTPISGFLDSGSSILFIPSPTNNSLPDCDSVAGGSRGSSYSGIYCPSTIQGYTATNYGSTGTPSGTVAFQVENGYSLFTSQTNSVFSTIAGNSLSGSTATFDWGLPFFFGKSVYVGLENTTSTLGTGPYWAY